MVGWSFGLESVEFFMEDSVEQTSLVVCAWQFGAVAVAVGLVPHLWVEHIACASASIVG